MRGWISFSLWSGPQIHPEVFDITCVSSFGAVKAVALFVRVQSYPAGFHFQTAYIHFRQAGVPGKFSKSNPLRNSIQMELICVAGRQFCLKGWLDLLSPILYLQGFRPTQLPTPQPTHPLPASYLRRGAVWAWSVPWSLWRSSSTT